MTTEERKNIAHVLKHLESNKIHLEGFHSGWYSGKKADFVKRHVKAIEYFTKLLKGEKP